MSAEGPDFELPFGILIGQTRPRTDRPVKNGRWYLIRPGLLAKVGWGDLAFDDMEQIAAVLRADDVFLVLPEHPLGGRRSPTEPASEANDALEAWRSYDPPDAPPWVTPEVLADRAWYALLDGQVRFVDHFGLANRRGSVWRPRDPRYTAAGGSVGTGRIRLQAIRTADLLHRLTETLAGRLPSAGPEFGEPAPEG